MIAQGRVFQPRLIIRFKWLRMSEILSPGPQPSVSLHLGHTINHVRSLEAHGRSNLNGEAGLMTLKPCGTSEAGQ